MKNFDTELDVQGVSRLVKATTEVTVEETVTVTPKKMSESRAFIAKEQWAWDDLRDYVVSNIEQRFGPFPRNSFKEAGIFKSFLARWGDQAQAIARFAFEVEDGRWAGAPISVNRFCIGSDPYFAEPISQRIVDTPVKDW